MENENVVADQPQLADINQSSFLGTERFTSADQNPEPAAEAAPVLEEEVIEEPAAEVEEAEAEPEQPQSQDEWFNGLSQEEHAYYAKRYPSLYNAYQDADQPTDLRQAFKDRVNQDRAWEERNRAAVEKEPTLEDEQETEAQTTTDPTQQREQYYQQIDSLVKEAIDPQAVQQLGTSLIEALGVDINSKDPEVMTLVQNASKVGNVLARGATDLIATILPRLLPQVTEQLYPGTAEAYQVQTANSAWEEVRNSNPNFAKLPAYGKREGDFGKLVNKVLQENPEVAEMQFRGSARQQAVAFYKVVAKLAAGQTVSPAVVETALKTGQRQAAAHSQKLAAGKALGAGRSNRTLEQDGNESPMKKGFDVWKQRDSNVF